MYLTTRVSSISMSPVLNDLMLECTKQIQSNMALYDLPPLWGCWQKAVITYRLEFQFYQSLSEIKTISLVALNHVNATSVHKLLSPSQLPEQFYLTNSLKKSN